MKLGGTTDEEKVHLLIDWIRNTQKELRIPRAIRFYGKDALPTEQGFIPEAVFEERLPQIAKDALLDACTSSNPRKPTESEMKSCSKPATTIGILILKPTAPLSDASKAPVLL